MSHTQKKTICSWQKFTPPLALSSPFVPLSLFPFSPHAHGLPACPPLFLSLPLFLPLSPPSTLLTTLPILNKLFYIKKKKKKKKRKNVYLISSRWPVLSISFNFPIVVLIFFQVGVITKAKKVTKLPNFNEFILLMNFFLWIIIYTYITGCPCSR